MSKGHAHKGHVAENEFPRHIVGKGPFKEKAYISIISNFVRQLHAIIKVRIGWFKSVQVIRVLFGNYNILVRSTLLILIAFRTLTYSDV